MGARTTEEQARKIIRLYESKKSLKEITAETGRSREAITKVLSDYGLKWDCWDYRRVEDIAEDLYIKDHPGTKHSFCGSWRKEISDADAKPYMLKAKQEMINTKKLHYDFLFEGAENSDKTSEASTDVLTVHLKDNEKEALDKLVNDYQIDAEHLIGFLIIKESIENTRRSNQ